jgi:hypothetical protein
MTTKRQRLGVARGATRGVVDTVETVRSGIGNYHTTIETLTATGRSEAADELHQGVTKLLVTLHEQVHLLSKLLALLEHGANSKPPVARLTYRLDELAAAIGVSRRVIERERAAGRLPRPDMHLGKMPLFRPETIRAWLESGGKGG